MADEREIRKETGFWGGEKEVIYENGQKVGEIKSEERGGFFGIGGDTVKVEYNTNGDEVGYTKQEERGGFLGIGTEEVHVRYDTHGEEVGQSRVEEKGGFLGIGTHYVRVEYDTDGNEVSQSNWEKRGGFLGIGEERVRVTRYKDGKPPTVVVDTGGGGGSSESNDPGAAVVIVLIIIGALWWFGSNTKTNKSDTTPNVVSTSSQTETLYVNALQLNLRAGPGTSYEQIAKLNANDAVTLLGTSNSIDSGNWRKIKIGNIEGWVNKNFLNTDPIYIEEITLTAESYGDVFFGSPLADIAIKLGEEKPVGEMAQGGNPDSEYCDFVHFQRYPKVRFMVEKGIVTRADVEAGVPNVLGLHEGSSLADVKLRYPSVQINPHNYDSEGHNLIIKSSDGKSAIIMQESKGRVTAIRAGVEPSVGYMEGCS